MSIQTPEQVLQQAIRAAGGIVHSDGNIFFTNAEQFRRAALSLPAAAVPTDERAAKDYAIEHAEYMAQAGEHFITAVNALHTLYQQLADGEPCEPADIEGAESNVSEMMSGLRGGIFEFRKRRDRTLASPAPAAAPEQQQQDIRDGSALSASAPSAEGLRERVEGYVYARQQAADFVRSAGHPVLASSILLNWAPGFLPPACPSCEGSGDCETFVQSGGSMPWNAGDGHNETHACPDCNGEGLDYGSEWVDVATKGDPSDWRLKARSPKARDATGSPARPGARPDGKETA